MTPGSTFLFPWNLLVLARLSICRSCRRSLAGLDAVAQRALCLHLLLCSPALQPALEQVFVSHTRMFVTFLCVHDVCVLIWATDQPGGGLHICCDRARVCCKSAMCAWACRGRGRQLLARVCVFSHVFGRFCRRILAGMIRTHREASVNVLRAAGDLVSAERGRVTCVLA